MDMLGPVTFTKCQNIAEFCLLRRGEAAKSASYVDRTPTSG